MMEELSARIHHQWHISVDLGWHGKPVYKWVLEDERGNRFQARRVTYSDNVIRGRRTVGASGTAIKADGTFGVIDRSVGVPWDKVPEPIQDAIRDAANTYGCSFVVAPSKGDSGDG